MIEPTIARPGIDPTFKKLLDAYPMTFNAADGVEVARTRLKQLEVPAELLPDLRVEQRTIDHGELTDIPVRIYFPPDAGTPSPIVVFYHGGGFALGDLDTHEPVVRAHAVLVAAHLDVRHAARIEDTQRAGIRWALARDDAAFVE